MCPGWIIRLFSVTCQERYPTRIDAFSVLVFFLFLNDLPDALRYTTPRHYADDFRNYSGIERDEISRWMGVWSDRNNPSLNVSKTQAMVFNGGSRRVAVPDFILNCELVPVTEWSFMGCTHGVYAGLRTLYSHATFLQPAIRKNSSNLCLFLTFYTAVKFSCSYWMIPVSASSSACWDWRYHQE